MIDKNNFLSIIKIFLFLFVIFISNNIYANDSTDDDIIIDSKMQLEVIDSITSKFNIYYVFLDVAEKMESQIRQNYTLGLYDSITSMSEFASTLTEQMQEISKDKHLKIIYRPNSYFETRLNEDPSDEELLDRLDELKYYNFEFETVKRLRGNIGYVKFNQFEDPKNATPAAAAALNFLANCDALIIDLRSNGGGYPEMVQFLTGYFFSEAKLLNEMYIRSEDRTVQYWSYDTVSGTRMDSVELFIVVSNNTFSAAEEFAYNLKNMGRAKLIGMTTMGGAHEWEYFNCRKFNLEIRIPFKRAINPITHTNWEGVGVAPHIEASYWNAVDVAYLEAAKTLRQKETDNDHIAQLDWIIENQNSKLNPLEVDEEILKSYEGNYGSRKIVYENCGLYSIRNDGRRRRMIPISETLFRFDEIDYFRIEIRLNDNGYPDALIGHSIDGEPYVLGEKID